MIVIRARKLDEETIGTLRRRLEVGDSPKLIASEWNVEVTTVYYWIGRAGIDLKEIKKQIRSDLLESLERPKNEHITYYSYLNKAVKRGSMSKKTMRQSLSKFYNYRHLPISTSNINLGNQGFNDYE